MSKLAQTIPFRFLSDEERASLLLDMTEHHYTRGEVILRRGDPDDRVFLIEEGAVEMRDEAHAFGAPMSVMTAGHYFGERAVLFEEPRNYEVRALEPTRCVAMSGERFLDLLLRSRAFAQALSVILRGKQGIFSAVDQFITALQHQVTEGELRLKSLLPLYLALEPALHGKAQSSALDLSALSYAVRRLPDNITRTFSFFLTDNLPELYSEPAKQFTSIQTKARPRTVYELLPGKDMVLLRDGLSDLLDFLTCLCVYAVEARKIRHRLRAAKTLSELLRFVRAPEDQASERFVRGLPFSPLELEQLRDIWPQNISARLCELALHHEDFRIEVQKQKENYNPEHSERWTAQIAAACEELTGYAPGALPPEVRVHIISSNTHSVVNCLSPYLTTHAEEIRAWGDQRYPDRAEGWTDPHDHMYALAREFFAAHPERARERNLEEASLGLKRLSETAFTGIEVQLIDTSTLQKRPIDPGVTPIPENSRVLIVNIDFAFGQQAEEIIGNLLMLFGDNLSSVNILGKAGALTGKRGELLVPTAFIEQSNDLLHQLPDRGWLNMERLQRRVPHLSVHHGPMLTVAGTLLQNRRMLHFYRSLWGCVGLEMEGAFYFRKLRESRHLRVIGREVALRFLYYVSDLPLDHSANLAGRMSPQEGIPPLYAITREILSAIFS